MMRLRWLPCLPAGCIRILSMIPGRGSNINALETLKKRRGDHLAHSALFASLTRSLGIPTRSCVGLLLQRSNGIYHSWTEVWINGTWIPVDTTVNRVRPAKQGIFLPQEVMVMVDVSDKFCLGRCGMNRWTIKFISATKYHENPADRSKWYFSG